jgi:hypothetical protein
MERWEIVLWSLIIILLLASFFVFGEFGGIVQYIILVFALILCACKCFSSGRTGSGASPYSVPRQWDGYLN